MRPIVSGAPAERQVLRSPAAGGALTKFRLRALAYAGALTLAEVLGMTIDPRLGGALHALVLVLLLQHGARCVVVPEQRLYWALSLVPILRLVSVSLPLGSFPLVWRYVVVAVPLLLAAVVAARALGHGMGDVGLRWRWRAAPLHVVVGLAGVPLGVLEYQLLKPAPLVTELTLPAALVPAGVLLVATGLTEEVLFRGLLQRTSGALLGQWFGPFLITCLWTVLHLGYGSWPMLGLAFLAGSLFAAAAGGTGSIWGVSLAHGLANVTLFLIAPFWNDPWPLQGLPGLRGG